MVDRLGNAIVNVPEFLHTLLAMLGATEAIIIIYIYDIDVDDDRLKEYMNPIRDLGPLRDDLYDAVDKGMIVMILGEDVKSMLNRISTPMLWYENRQNTVRNNLMVLAIDLNGYLDIVTGVHPLFELYRRSCETWYKGDIDRIDDALMYKSERQTYRVGGTMIDNLPTSYRGAPSTPVSFRVGTVETTYHKVLVLNTVLMPNSSVNMNMSTRCVDELRVINNKVVGVPDDVRTEYVTVDERNGQALKSTHTSFRYGSMMSSGLVTSEFRQGNSMGVTITTGYRNEGQTEGVGTEDTTRNTRSQKYLYIRLPVSI
ncbi:hypothetical protein F4802DRAFT_591189 [Xylaria palmicola]|nr:hypothetical protein F4802DRAFT_591189 [Xylaria palmicola]